jgi:hypothetical protein
MDRNPERITFDPFVLPYETPLDICFRSLLLFNVFMAYRETLDLAAGVCCLTFLYIHICTWLLWLGKRKLSFVPLHCITSFTRHSQCFNRCFNTNNAHVTAAAHATPLTQDLKTSQSRSRPKCRDRLLVWVPVSVRYLHRFT